MKLIMENWRQYLNEGIDPRIQKRLEMLLTVPDLGVAVFGTDPAQITYVRIYDAESNDWATSRRGNEWGHPSGKVSIRKTEQAHEGSCYDGWVIETSAAKDGWGPLLYEVALEWASQNGGGLASDRAIVSGDARAVWDKYAARSDVNIKQMDVDHKHKGGSHQFGYEGWMKKYPQLTPDIPEDDCDQLIAIGNAGEKWHETSLSKMYSKGSPEVMTALEQAGRLMR